MMLMEVGKKKIRERERERERERDDLELMRKEDCEGRESTRGSKFKCWKEWKDCSFLFNVLKGGGKLVI